MTKFAQAMHSRSSDPAQFPFYILYRFASCDPVQMVIIIIAIITSRSIITIIIILFLFLVDPFRFINILLITIIIVTCVFI